MLTISTQALGPTETQIMNVAWSHDGESLTVRDVRTQLAGDLAYTTVMTVMERLAQKGILSRGDGRMGQGGAYHYVAAISRGELLAATVEQMCVQLGADRADRDAALAALIGPPR
jgi:predicted transcriptional regulator